MKSFLKTDGVFSHGKWFCSENHSQNDPEFKTNHLEMQAKLKAKMAEVNGGQDDDDDDEAEEEYEI